MSQPKNPANKSYVDKLVALKGAAKDRIRIENIEACLKKARETQNAITQDQVIWAIHDGKDTATAAIDNRLDQAEKVHNKAKKIDHKKVFSYCLGSSAMMAGQGNNSSSLNPPPAVQATFGCVPSKDARPVPNTTAAPASAGRPQPTSTATTAQPQSTATAGRGQSSTTTTRATQTKPTFQIPNPTEDEIGAVASYSEKWGPHDFGMHTIWAQIRIGPQYSLPQKEVNIDIFYDTGSTAQGVPAKILEAMIGKDADILWWESESTTADGKTHSVHMGAFQLKLFMDRQRKKPLSDWFITYGDVNAFLPLSGGHMRFTTGLHFMNLPDDSSPLFVGKSMPAVMKHMYKWH